MATTRSFSDMLNEYLPNDLFKDEMLQRDWFLSNVEKDNNWKGGDIIVPFQGNAGSSISFGSLTADTDIAEYDYVRGKISGYKEVWGSLVFNETDLMQHDGRIKEQSFLKMLPDQVEQFMQYMKMAVSTNMLTGPHFATATDSTNANVGVFVVDKIDRFDIGQKLSIDDNNSAAANAYVIAINVNTSEVTLSDSRGGAAFDFSAYTVAQSAKFYHPGAQATSFQTVRDALLSAANGGGASLHGQTKTAFPALQAINYSGATITATNILDKLFDAWTQLKTKAKAANPSKCVMSYKHLGTIMKLIETEKSPFKVSVGQTKASKYAWTEVEITGVRGGFSLVGIQEMDDDVIFFLDMSAMTFRSNGFFKKKMSPEGIEYYRIRATTGFKLVCDICLFGELEVRKPATCMVIHSINY